MKNSERLPIKQIILISFFVSVIIGYFYWNQSQSTELLQYVTPKEVGWSSEKLENLESLVEESGYSAIMAAYDGKVFYSWGEVSTNYNLHSIRKPIQSAIFGIHVDSGEINLGETLFNLGIDDIPPSLSNEEKQATVRELLLARSGVYHEAAAEDTSMIELRPSRGSHLHGTFYYYNNWDFNTAIEIFNLKTGMDILEAIKLEIADPIGMQDFSLDNCRYSYEPEKSQFPAIQIRMSARDLLRFGVLYQQSGKWLNDQVIPSWWIEESTTTYSIVDEDSGIGYGYMWRTIPVDSLMARIIGSSGYYHTGIGVQVLIVLPVLKLVIVELIDTDGQWWLDSEARDRQGDLGMEIGLKIIEARSN